jgi:hypothetical protein
VSLHIVVNCERSVPYGTCAARLYTGAATEAEAFAVAERAGWDVNGTPHYCPAHAPRRTARRGPPCGNNPQAVTDFKTYLKKRKETNR